MLNESVHISFSGALLDIGITISSVVIPILPLSGVSIDHLTSKLGQISPYIWF